MFGGVFILRGITAADVAAVHTQSEVHPLIAGFQTLLASMRVRNDFLDLGQMCTLVHNSNVHPKETWGQTSKSPKSQYLVCPRISLLLVGKMRSEPVIFALKSPTATLRPAPLPEGEGISC